MKIYNKLIILLVIIGFAFSVHAQQQNNDRRTNETKIADIAMQLPAKDTETFNRLMQELIRSDNVIPILASKLLPPGHGNDSQVRAAISGLALYASQGNNPTEKKKTAEELCNAIKEVQSDELKDFLLIQLQYVAGAESVGTAAQYLNSARLADAAARVLIRIGNDDAGKAMTAALGKTAGAQQITLVEALGYMRYQPANDAIGILATTGNAKLRKAALYSLAQIADPSSETILAEAAEKAGYNYESTDALGSYVLYLNNSLPTQADVVEKSAQNMLKTTSEVSQIAAKSAALELYVMALRNSDEKKAVNEILTALKSSDKQYRLAALDYSSYLQTPKMYKELTELLKKEQNAERKAEIIRALSARGVTEIEQYDANSEQNPINLIIGYLQDKDMTIRAAAVEATGRLANVLPENNANLSKLVAAINTNDEGVVGAGKNTLLTLKNSNLLNEVANAIPQATPAAKTAFLEILAARQAVSQSETIFAQTSSPDANVRLAAYKALAPVAVEKDVPRIAQLLNAASNEDEVIALQQAFFAAVSEQSQDRQTELVMEQASISNNPSAYGNLLAMVGGKKALDLVMSSGFNSGDPKLKEAAFEALIEWSDNSATPQLYKIAADNPSGPYFDKALTAYISKIQFSKNTPEQKLLLLRNALDIAKTPEQKKIILQQIGRTGTFLGLITAGKYLDDNNNDIQQAAVQAVQTIALAHPEYYGSEITALLNKAIAVNKDTEADYQKQAILKHLASLPTDNGFVSMFNGRDLTGWKGLVENPITRAKMTPKQLAEKQVKADEIMRRDWKVENGLLVYEGKGYENLCSGKIYGDFELYVDWRIDPETDSGIYLRGSPQVQIWDTANKDAQVGSGGLYNNQKNPSIPSVVADNPVNEWNSFYIRMEGDKVTIYLNGQLVTDHTILENYWDRSLPIFPEGAVELQAHTSRIAFRDIYIREIPRPKAYAVSDAEKKEGFVPMFNGVNMTGWIGNLNDYYAKDGMIVCDPAKGGRGNLYTEKEYSDFVMRFEFLLTPAANNGLGIRAPLEGDAAYVGMELQILDNEAEVYKDLHEYQYHGSVYGVIPAKRGYLKPLGEWNYQEVIAKGNRITITLNGTVILDGDIAEASKNFTATIDGNKHPGLSNKQGHIGFLGHGSWVAFKNLRIKELK
ncbi:MAG: DUF1080 domain-containing protein [Candidatus Azobacteroides sp.]|nr:DUF1080 domain-containing protein [Candidatus Azobacteroides sp.]